MNIHTVSVHSMSFCSLAELDSRTKSGRVWLRESFCSQIIVGAVREIVSEE